MRQSWVTSSQIQSFCIVASTSFVLVFGHRLNIMSDTLRSSRSRSRTSSSWFHSLRRSCWRQGSRQVGGRPSASCFGPSDITALSPPDWTVVASHCFGSSGDMKCESRNHLFNEASPYRKMQYLVRVTFVSWGPKLQFMGKKKKKKKVENSSVYTVSSWFSPDSI